MDPISPITPDAWGRLRDATPARIALGRAGGSLPTHEWLDFRACHAAARDAVHFEFDAQSLAAEVARLGAKSVVVESSATDRSTYLQRPELGRRLSEPSRNYLETLRDPGSNPDLALIVSDGLSALAAHRQATPMLSHLLPRLTSDGWRVAPIVIARFGRVALQDEIGHRLGARLALILIGERPGLGSPDSLGAYVVFNPRVGNTDVNRNCVSNIRPEGLPPEAAAETLHFLLTEARRRQLSGVGLKNQRTLTSAT